MGALFAIRRRHLPTVGGALAGAVLCLSIFLAGATEAQALVNNCVPRPLAKHRVLRVGTFNGKKGQCKTIQEAINVAGPGNWILIAPGDYKEGNNNLASGALGDDKVPADLLVTTPNLHIRGMNRNTVVIDGTKPGSPKCSSAEGDQLFGPVEGGGWQGRNGIVVYKAEGVWLQNFSACNFLGGNRGGDEIWFDGQQSSGKQELG